MVQYDPLYRPTAEELPDSDDTPVDNELHYWIPSLLGVILARIWSERTDWFFAANMGVYYVPGQMPQVPIVPDGFLSLGVPRHKQQQEQRSREELLEKLR